MFEKLRRWWRGELPEGSFRTKSGRVLHDEDFEKLADEAERGYDVSHLKPRVVTPVASRPGLTDDRDDPAIRKVDPATNMQERYLVLSDEERARGFVRPVRTAYVHTKCGAVTTMNLAIAETYARDPSFYGGTYCVGCKEHFPVGADGEFIWDDGSGAKVGT